MLSRAQFDKGRLSNLRISIVGCKHTSALPPTDRSHRRVIDRIRRRVAVDAAWEEKDPKCFSIPLVKRSKNCANFNRIPRIGSQWPIIDKAFEIGITGVLVHAIGLRAAWPFASFLL